MEQKIAISNPRRYLIAKNVFEAYDPLRAGSSYSELNAKLKGWIKHRAQVIEGDCMDTFFFGMLPAITYGKEQASHRGDWNGEATLLYFWSVLEAEGKKASDCFGVLSSSAMDETLKRMRPENRDGFLMTHSRFLFEKDIGFFSFIFPLSKGKFDFGIVMESIKKDHHKYSGILGTHHLLSQLLKRC